MLMIAMSRDKIVDILYADDEWINFRVKSDSRNEYQYVCYDELQGWTCTCEDYYYRRSFCKHMRKAKDYLNALNRKVQLNNVAFKGK